MAYTCIAPTCKTNRVESIKQYDISCSKVGRGRVALFVDEGNLFHAAAALRIQVNYACLLAYVTRGCQCSGAFFYTAVKSDEHKRQLQSRGSLRDYQIIDRQMIWYEDGSVKANLDVEIASDIVSKAFQDLYDTAVLISGDGDFTYAVNKVREQGRRVEVIGLRRRTSRSLIAASDYYTDLSDIKQWVH